MKNKKTNSCEVNSNFVFYDLNIKASQIKNSRSVQNSLDSLVNFVDNNEKHYRKSE